MRAGYNAYYAAFSTGHFGANHKPHQTNPAYTKNPQRIQWIRGWQTAQKNHESGGQFSYNPFKGVDLGNLGREPVQRQTKQQEFQKRQAEFKARQKSKPRGIVQSSTLPAGVGQKPHTYVKKEVPAPINLRRLDKFNKKHRTKV